MEKQVIFEQGGWVLYEGKCDAITACLRIENTNNFEKFSIEIELPSGREKYDSPSNKKMIYNIDDIEIIHSSGSKVCDVEYVEEYIEAIDDAISFVDRLVKYMLEHDLAE